MISNCPRASVPNTPRTSVIIGMYRVDTPNSLTACARAMMTGIRTANCVVTSVDISILFCYSLYSLFIYGRLQIYLSIVGGILFIPTSPTNEYRAVVCTLSLD